MRVLILGGQGMLGHKLFEVLQREFVVFATFRQQKGLWSQFPMYVNHPETLMGGVDARQFHEIISTFAKIRPHVVVNCIGIIKQLKEAHNPIISIETNALFPHQLADLCQATGARLIHLSTDCIFSGQHGNYQESDVSDVNDLYGVTKKLGEVDQEGCLTLRTSIIGRDYLKNVGLVEWFLGQRGRHITGFTKAIYSGFTTLALSRLIKDVIYDYPHLSGIYHVASAPISKYELLKKIEAAAGLNIEIEPTADFVCDRSLRADKFLTATSYTMPSWETMITDFVAEFEIYDQWRKKYGIR